LNLRTAHQKILEGKNSRAEIGFTVHVKGKYPIYKELNKSKS
jgi:hypothetical protein